ncbi:benzoate/H(+) symporter BenE family transporter [Geomonas sp. RF6]|uniref:benzoate/H(+) symporter BenE family transporter n=1 Tax=Geomonas sp. RF6 TaxID=2897342 RepID=UPI001E3A00BE|nr:benzoate/H(+) symporter BenE family transporter [Geomonas sp. RF6]UFS69542.1 benzoate/H(+) symporter BenE family transporter [Geomonas sp. RF6]
MRPLKDLSFSAVVAGFVAVVVAFTSSAVIVFQAAQALGANPDEIASWILSLCLAMGATTIVLSLRYRVPVLTAWSTPGAAMLVTSVAGVSMRQAIGAFIVCSALIVLSGVTGWFERAMQRIPLTLGAAMLAGVLLRFGLQAFSSMQTQPILVGSMFAAYLVARRCSPRAAVPLVLITGTLLSLLQGRLHLEGVPMRLALPLFTMPDFSFSAIASVAIPLFMVTMASQNVPGVATIRTFGYRPPISPLITWTGASSLLLAPFGAYAINLAAITAAITMGREAHHDPDKRYMAAVAAGIFYLVVGLFGASVAALFAMFPHEMIVALAGLALLGTIGNGLAAALQSEKDREPAVITFLVTASGLTLFGIGAAFWGIVAGIVATLVYRKPLLEKVEAGETVGESA